MPNCEYSNQCAFFQFVQERKPELEECLIVSAEANCKRIEFVTLQKAGQLPSTIKEERFGLGSQIGLGEEMYILQVIGLIV